MIRLAIGLFLIVVSLGCAVYVASTVLGVAYRTGLIISSVRGSLHLRRVEDRIRRQHEAQVAAGYTRLVLVPPAPARGMPCDHEDTGGAA